MLSCLFPSLKGNRSVVLSMFVHIPKTAGTSFRASLENTQKVVNDYGQNKEHTSDLVGHYIYQQNDIYGLKDALSDKAIWLCGHMHLNKYLGIVQPENIVAFVREPTARVVSHFNHERRWGHKTITLEEFLRSNRAQNFQHRFLKGLPLTLIGFVGVTEQYSKSLSLIETEMALKVEETKFNANDRKVSDIEDIDEELLALIKAQNQLDEELYQSAKRLMLQREEIARANQPWTYIYAVRDVDGRLEGVAFRRNESRPVCLELIVNGESREVMVASQHTTLFPEATFPRNRFIGFRSCEPIKPEKSVVLKVKDTQQQHRI